jgi:hypothetical protein
MGCGEAGANILGGMLSIVANTFDAQWTKLEGHIGISQIPSSMKI